MTGVVLRWRGPPRDQASGATGAGQMALAAIVGAPGQSGSSDGLGNFTAAMAMPAGTPVTVSRVNGQIFPADAASYATALVIGTTQAPVEAGFAVEVARGSQTLADWTAVAGAAALLTGQMYFLGAGGGIITAVPARPGCAALTAIGTALSAQTLDIRPTPPIALN